MTVLCTDKTGTLTSAEITLAKSLDAAGAADDRAARLGAIAAELGGDRGALDAALVAGAAGAARAGPCWRDTPSISTGGWARSWRTARKATADRQGRARSGDRRSAPRCGRPTACARWAPANATAAQALVRALAEQGLRSIAVASRPWSGASHELDAGDEADLVFEGICAFADPPKATCTARHRAAGGGRHPGEDPVRRRSGRGEAAGRPGRPRISRPCCRAPRSPG